MNKRQKIVQEQFLDDEEKVIKRLKQVYGQSLKDINGKVAKLDSSIGQLQKALAGVGDDDIGDLARAFLGSKKQFTPEEAKETLQSMIQSKVYQKNYQKALQKQVGGILDTMHEKEFKIVSDYLTECYENGFVGTMFDLQGQGIPMCFPLDQEAMVRAVQLDSKISQGLYSRLGEDVALLKKKITAQVSRGISTGMSYQQVAKQLAGYTNIGFNNAVRIARTEGHRVQVQSAMDACYKAKDKGADVVKQWDASLDKRTRESHAMVDGEIRELDKPFSNGLMFPGDPDGEAAEVINCRCALLQRARWALDDDELQTLQDRAKYFGLDKTENFEDFKKKYLKAAETSQQTVDEDKHFKKDVGKVLTNTGKSSKIVSGAISGGRNPLGEKAKEHAERYYESVRKMKNDVATIARNLDLPEEEIQAVKSFIFLDKHDLGNGTLEHFSPDYMMAESWQRLIDGSQKPHDVTLIRHEILERQLMNGGLSQEEAHIKASAQFNYSKEAREYYAKIKKYNDD